MTRPEDRPTGIWPCNRCGYELSYDDLPRGSGIVSCPECGKVLGSKRGA